MTELFESVKIGLFDEKHDDECYFCNNEEEITDEDNNLDDDFAEDEMIGMESAKEGFAHKNSAGMLGTACAPAPDEVEVKRSEWGPQKFQVRFAAHHLIPGDASLQNSKFFKSKKYLRVKGQAAGNIGYNVNNNSNGVWLPGNYAYSQKASGSEWGTKGAEFKKIYKVEPEEYSFVAMETTASQFHDAHPDYNDFVKKALDKIFNKLKEAKNIANCPEAKKRAKKRPEDQRPLYILINRFATISNRMRGMLMFPTENWKKNIYTSSFALNWMDKQKKHRAKKSPTGV